MKIKFYRKENLRMMKLLKKINLKHYLKQTNSNKKNEDQILKLKKLEVDEIEKRVLIL